MSSSLPKVKAVDPAPTVEISERPRANLDSPRGEISYRSFAEALPQMVWAATGAGEVTYYSSRWYTYAGIPSDRREGWGWQRIIHPDDLQSCVEAWTYALSHGTPFEAQHRLQRSDGAYRWFLTRALPICDDEGSITQWFATATDVNDQKRTLEAQQRLTAQLEVIVEATERLTNSIDTQESLQMLSDLITPRFADWMAVNLVEPDGNIKNVALVHADPSKAGAVAAMLGTDYVDPRVRGSIVTVIQTRQPFLAAEMPLDDSNYLTTFPEQRNAFAELGCSSVISVPLLVRGRVVGVLTTVWAQSDQRFSVAEIPFFEVLAKRASIAFDEATRHGLALVNEEITRRIMQSSEDCIAVLGLDAHLITANDQGAATFKLAGAALEPGCDWLTCWRPEDRPAASAALASARSGSTGKYQGCLNAGDTEPQWWDVVVTPITDVVGTPTQLLAVSRNITRQKVHENTLTTIAARYQAFANAIPAIAFTATADGKLDFVNDRWMEYTGLSHDVSLKQGLVTVTHPDEQPTLTADWFTAFEPGGAHEAETRLRRATDGEYRWHLIRAVPNSNADGEIVQWFGTGTDIDDRKRAEAAILEARDAALFAATMKSQFVATMSHEIRTPISGVIGMTELLLITQLTEEQREYANVVRDSGESLLRVINDILDYSKLDAGKMQLESVEFYLRRQLKSVTDLLRPQIHHMHISVTTQVEPDVPEFVLGDPGRVRQVLVNLMGNAVKFTPRGGAVHVAVSCTPGEGGKSRVRFEIKDSGVGIAPHLQARLFQAFAQGDGSTTRRYGGTGLGLSICKQLVTLMDGEIGVESVLGQGSSFWFSIELALAERPGAMFAVPSSEVAEPRAALGSNHKILLVEDNKINTLLARKQFEQLGFSITSVVNGLEALQAIRNTSFDLVFMDCHMPEMDGFEATRQIRRLERGAETHLPIVAMTADARSEDQKACLETGMDDYLSKPTSLAQIRVMLERWLPAVA